ncbi:MAG: DUF5362 family protein [Bacteroidales bacterium]|jgi:hypothetical protein|nr:DUF5362 family protein [Bacteroidales bacterium]
MEENQQEEMMIRELMQPLKNATGWIKFLGVLLIIYGVVSALTIVGILIAWLPIWLGVLLLRAAKNTNSAYYQGNKSAVLAALNNVGSFFTVYGVVALIGILFFVAFFIFIIATGVLWESMDAISNIYL